MGLLNFFAQRTSRKALSASPAVVEALSERDMNPVALIGVGAGRNSEMQRRISAAFETAQSSSYAYMYRTQPSVRTVVDFIARNVAQLGLRLYERTSDTERHERGDHPAAVALRQPNQFMPGKQFIFNLIADFMVHDNAYALKLRPAPGDPLTLLPLPASMMGLLGDGRFQVDGYRVHRPDGDSFDVPPGDVVHIHGYNPDDPRMGVSKLETLRQVLAEEAAARTAGVELMKAGLAKPGYIKRGVDAGDWSDDARQRFQESWASQTARSPRVTPVLEDGMEFEDFGITPKDAEMLDGRRFTREEVAALYGVPLGLIGLEQGELEQQHRQFYADVLPPICELLASYLNLAILQAEYQEDSLYYQFDINEKLMGDERLKALTSASGRPVLLTDEARAMLDLPPVKGGDQLVTPANVIVGDNPKPSTDVMPIQDPNKPSQEGDFREQALPARNGKLTAALEDEIRGHFQHQRTHPRTRYDSPAANNALEQRLLKHVDSTDPRIKRAVHASVEAINQVTNDTHDLTAARATKEARRVAAFVEQDLDHLRKLAELGVPREVLWERAGFTRSEVDRMRAMQEQEFFLDAAAVALAASN